MAYDRSAKRKNDLEESIARLRADTFKELADMVDEYEKEKKPWHDTFKILEDINQPDHHNKSGFEAIVTAEKRAMKVAGDGVIAALDAMEKDMRAGHEKFEQRVREEGEPSDGIVLITKTYCIRDYYRDPSNM